MNHSTLIVKIIAQPKQSFIKDSIPVTEILVKFPLIKSNTNCNDIFIISIWGSLSYDVIKYYSRNKYMIIEGYLSIHEKILRTKKSSMNKQVKLSVLKMYPLY